MLTDSNLIKTEIPLSEVRQGMTVEHNGSLVTVGKNCLKYDELMGYSFRGDSSMRKITQVQFKVPTLRGFQLR